MHFLVPWTWFHGCMLKVCGSLDLVAYWRLLVPWNRIHGCPAKVPACLFHFLVHWSWFYGCLVKVPGCVGSLPTSLDLVPWLPGEGSWLLGFISQLTAIATTVAWWRLLDTWTHILVLWAWFHGCLLKVPGCLDFDPASLDLVPWWPS